MGDHHVVSVYFCLCYPYFFTAVARQRHHFGLRMAATCIEVPYRVRSNGGGQEERKRLAASRGGRMKSSSEEKHGRATVEDKEKHRKVKLYIVLKIIV